MAGSLLPVLIAAALLLSGAPTQAKGVGDGVDATGPLDISGATLVQHGRSLVFKLRARGEWYPRMLDRQPEPGDSAARFACVRIHKPGKSRTTQLCFGKRESGRGDVLGLTVLQNGTVVDRSLIDARLKSDQTGRFEAAFRPDKAGLRPGRYRFHAATQWSGEECVPEALPCDDVAPDSGEARFQLRRVKQVGCKIRGSSLILHGPQNRKRVALTFDDGPSGYTSSIASILNTRKAKGTFFAVGSQLGGREAQFRKLLKSGHELANHSYEHAYKPSYSSMATTSKRIKAATGFEPCLFRPPYGAYDSRVVGDARALGMTTTLWDVDPQDWTTPGSSAIYQRVVANVRPGSIVVMHDGGGNRSQTVGALSPIVQNLQGRGYRLVTVSQLMGYRPIWKPVKKGATQRRRAIKREPLPPDPSMFEPPPEFRAEDNPHGLGRE